MEFGAVSRGFSPCCLRFKNRVATTPARLASGWLARLYREGVEPSGSLQKVSDHISRPPFLDLSWRKGSFMRFPWHCMIEAPWSVDLQPERLYHRRPENNVGFEATPEFLGRCVGTGFET